MDREFNQSLNEVLKEKYQNAKKLLDERIENLANAISSDQVSETNFTRMNDAITKMEKLSTEIDEVLKKLENEEIDFNETALFEGTIYEKSWNRNINSFEKATEKLSDLDNLKTRLNSIDTDKYQSLINHGNKVLERRIARLQKKKGKIQNNQHKLLNKRITRLLKNNMRGIYESNKIADRLIKNNQKDEKNDAKIETLNSKKDAIESQKDELASIRETLKSGKILAGISSSIPLFIKEKNIQARIKLLQMKKGRITKLENHIIKRNVGKSFIQKMKDKVANFDFIKKPEYDFMKPSEEWESDHVHSESQTIEAIQIDDEVYEVDKYGNFIKSLGKVEEIDTSNITFVTGDDLVTRKGKTKRR